MTLDVMQLDVSSFLNVVSFQLNDFEVYFVSFGEPLVQIFFFFFTIAVCYWIITNLDVNHTKNQDSIWYLIGYHC